MAISIERRRNQAWTSRPESKRRPTTIWAAPYLFSYNFPSFYPSLPLCFDPHQEENSLPRRPLRSPHQRRREAPFFFSFLGPRQSSVYPVCIGLQLLTLQSIDSNRLSPRRAEAGSAPLPLCPSPKRIRIYVCVRRCLSLNLHGNQCIKSYETKTWPVATSYFCDISSVQQASWSRGPARPTRAPIASYMHIHFSASA